MAISLAPGQIVGQGDWDALFTQHGGMLQNQQSILRPPTQQEIQAAATVGDDDPGFQQRPIYRYNLADGTYVEARTSRDGAGWEVVAYQPSQKFQQTQTPAAQAKQDTDWHTEGTPTGTDANGNTTYDNSQPIMVRTVSGVRQTRALTSKELQDWNEAQQRARNPGGKTDAEIEAEKPKTGEERSAVPNRPGWTTITRTTTQNGNATKVTTYVGPDGKEVGALPAEPEKPTIRIEDDGKGGLVAISVYPDGRPPTTTPIPGVTGKPQSVTVGGVIYERGPDGTYKPAPGIPTGAEPPGSPRPSGRLGEAAADLEAYDQWLEPQVREGKITPDRADKLREARRSFWQTALNEQTGIVNAQRQTFADQQSQRTATLTDLANRRSNATTIANQAANDWMPYADKFGTTGPGTPSLAAAIRASRNDAMNFVTLSGANRMVPEVQMGPALTSVNAMPLPGGTGAMSNLQVRPNAIGAGTVGAGVSATNAAAANPTGENVADANDATMQGPNAAFGALGVPAPASRPAPLLPPPPPIPGQTPQAVIQPSPYFLAGSSRGHVYDPTQAVQALIADPRIDNETVRRVVAQEYPGYPIDSLLGATS